MTVQLARPRAQSVQPAVGGRPVAAADGGLLEAIIRREAGGFEALVTAYIDRLFSLAWRVTGSREDAEEAVQDAFVKAHRALYGGYSAARLRELAPRAWLYSITLNTARNARRRRKPTSSLDDAGPDGQRRYDPADGALGPPALAENRELVESLERAIGHLPAKLRAAVVVRLVDGLSYDQAALALNRPVGTVKSDVHRGLRMLRQRLGALLDGEA